MQIRNSRTGFGLVAQVLHWSIAALIVNQFVLAQRAEAATLFEKLGILATHKSLGLTILALAALRLAWNTCVGVRPAAPPNEPLIRWRLARLSHALLYVLMIAMPLTGWLMSSAANTPVSYFGRLPLPDLIGPSERWAERLAFIHGSLFVVLVSVVTVHATAALYHHFVLKDDVLRRMVIPR